MRRFVVGQFLLVVALLLLWVLLGKFLGAGSVLAFAVVGMPLLALSTLGVMVWAAWGIRWRKFVVLLLAVVADVGFISGSETLSRTGDRLFFATRRSRLETFARDIVSYGRIHQMSDGLRSFTELNGELVDGSAGVQIPRLAALARNDNGEAALARNDNGEAPLVRNDTGGAALARNDEEGKAPLARSDSVAASRRRPLDEVLARDAITAQRYEEFRRRLRELKLTQFDARPGFVAFLYDGMLDNLEGYLLVKPGGSPPAMRSTLFGASLVRLEPIGDGWYRFVTT